MELGKTHYSTLSTDSNILFTCEHATGRIPGELGTLGLTREDLDTCKDLYDPGALELAKSLAKEFSASLLWSDLSRLVIDMNRYFDAPSKHLNSYHSGLIKKDILSVRNGKEVFIPIPDNQTISEKEERELYDAVCVPYQAAMLHLLSELKKVHKHVYIVSVHSFFPVYNGQIRDVDIDVMPYIDPDVAPIVRDSIKETSSQFTTEIDKPWGVKDADGGALHILADETDITVLALDIKNDNLDTSEKVSKVASAISSGLRSIVK